MLVGAIAMASFLTSLFFVKFWRRTSDRFFLFLAASFWIETGNRIILGLVTDPDEDRPLFYFIRLISFALILVAIADKNWSVRNQKSRIR